MSKQDFIIPDSFLKRLQEFSNGGFVLLTFSAQGKVVVHHLYDSEKDRIAIETALANWLDSRQAEQESGEESEEESEQEAN